MRVLIFVVGVVMLALSLSPYALMFYAGVMYRDGGPWGAAVGCAVCAGYVAQWVADFRGSPRRDVRPRSHE